MKKTTIAVMTMLQFDGDKVVTVKCDKTGALLFFCGEKG